MNTLFILFCAVSANAIFNALRCFSDKTIAEKQVFYTKAIFRFLMYGTLLSAGAYLDLLQGSL